MWPLIRNFGMEMIHEGEKKKGKRNKIKIHLLSSVIQTHLLAHFPTPPLIYFSSLVEGLCWTEPWTSYGGGKDRSSEASSGDAGTLTIQGHWVPPIPTARIIQSWNMLPCGKVTLLSPSCHREGNSFTCPMARSLMKTTWKHHNPEKRTLALLSPGPKALLLSAFVSPFSHM